MISLRAPPDPSPPRELLPHAVSADEFAAALGADASEGLQEHDAAARLEATGPNVVEPPKRPGLA